MRRNSDQREGERTGTGRRARDQILSGQTAASPAIQGRYELQNLMLFLSDDLRESALALGGIESFIIEAKHVLEKADLTAEQLGRLVDDDEVLERFDLLWDALASLRRSMGLIRDSLDD